MDMRSIGVFSENDVSFGSLKMKCQKQVDLMIDLLP